MGRQRVPNETIRRLPMYLRALLVCPADKRIISSDELADHVGLNSPQVRKDLSYFGAFGTPGVGYDVPQLTERIRDILGIQQAPRVALVGAGKLGRALVFFEGFKMYGFEIAAVFDNSPRKIGRKIGNLTVESLASIGRLDHRDIRLAILAVPAEASQEVAETLVAAGVTGILNMTFCRLKLPPHVKVATIDAAMELGVLPYYMNDAGSDEASAGPNGSTDRITV
ncbi:MAG TPA: redox-sensing transcriptional repressor Rex [Anaerohalosphaeraceae bacterium]|nr:redox-sensing transcriptional repressor Rex [Anaerohalosphaeraceae bacterium]HRT49766.1 redox-sensing transcriptional repressor Rex [Anaerohalosphaeraceae bacterium]HRT85574.1 redox-sensing transcriptional repressor Rex [Anaerohalosphaeraceae bacterium]